MHPLTGKRILVTRAASQSRTFRNLLEEQGATVIEMPTLEIGPPSSWEPLDEAIAHLPRFHWLILTSANAVEYFWQRLSLAEKSGPNSTALNSLKIAVVGKKTAAVLKQKGYEPDFTPPNFVADSLVEHFPDKLTNLQVLFPRVESGGREVLVKAFRTAGAQVTEVAAYESGCPKVVDPVAIAALRSGSLSAITFASSKTVRHFVQLIQQEFGAESAASSDESWLRYLDGVALASIGPQTSDECRKQFNRVDVEATEYTLEGLTAAIVDWAKQSS